MEHENAPVQASVAAVQAWGRIMAREHAVKCPNCKALYQLVRVEAGPETIAPGDNLPSLRQPACRARGQVRPEVFPLERGRSTQTKG